MDLFKRKDKQEEKRQPSLMNGQDGYTFRRSRTLTGSMSSSVRTAAEDRSHLQSPRLKLHQLEKHRRGVTAALVASFAIIVFLSWIVSQFIRIPVDFSYDQVLNQQPETALYRQAIESYFVQNPTERFLFRLDKQRLNAHVVSAYNEVNTVTVDSIGPGVYDISVDLRKPVLSWKSGASQLYVDRNGMAFEKNYFTEPTVAVDDQSGIRLDDSEVIASSRFIEFLGRIVGSVDASDAGLAVSKIIIPSGTTRQVDIQLASRSYPIKTHIDREPAAQAQDVINAVSYIERITPAPEYIDVRVPGKAFYR